MCVRETVLKKGRTKFFKKKFRNETRKIFTRVSFNTLYPTTIPP